MDMNANLTDNKTIEDNYAAISDLRDSYSKAKTNQKTLVDAANAMKQDFDKMMAERKREDEEFWAAKKEEDDEEAAFTESDNKKKGYEQKD